MKHLLILSAALLAWLTIAAAAMVPGTINTAVIPATTRALPDNVAIIGTRGPLLVVYSEDPNYVRNLYKSGVRFVLPARKKTCLNLQNA
ncbi:hypothetical protein [uncultured Litoreibacter sp.]|uniref:hypothetical protein n=1 Tax=uncultured Litoreibacter sp. TaxID=1392394 RepID=UPI00261C59BF|nr:hypothetical protein [uncultured Litoreibacter sp.]